MPVLKGIDYYGILGLTKNDEINDIKQAYRRVAVQYSAKWQKDPEASQLFSLAGEAYEVLCNYKLRAIYDKFGESGLKKGVLTTGGWHPPYVYHGDPIKTYRDFFGTRNPYADLLEEVKLKNEEFLGEGKGPKKKQPTQVIPLPLTLEEVYTGTYKKMKITRKVFKEGSRDETEIRERILPIHIRRGLLPGTEIVFKNLGDLNPITLPGDIMYVTEDKPHPLYYREGTDLILNKDVNLTNALGGMNVTIKTLDNRKFKIWITNIITPGFIKVVEGEGMPHVTDPDTYGNLIIKFNVTFPQYIPDVCKSLISKCLDEANELSNRKGEKLALENIPCIVYDQPNKLY